jgi:serine/threonine-protein kinase RIO1
MTENTMRGWQSEEFGDLGGVYEVGVNEPLPFSVQWRFRHQRGSASL